MSFVERNKEKQIIGLYARPQPGRAEEWVEGAKLYEPPQTREEVERLRLAAYGNPITGSDRFFAEATRMDATGELGADTVKLAGAARYAEIQAQFPWPSEK